MSVLDSNRRRLLLGTRDWQRPDWIEGYYPPGMPPEWRLAFYGNEADCVLLPAAVWADPGGSLDEQLEEAPEHLLFFLEAAPQLTAYEMFEPRFGERPAIVLAADSVLPDSVPSWPSDPAGGWRDPESDRLLNCLSLAEFDLRALRQEVQSLSPEVAVLILQGAAASPNCLSDVRTLIELLGRG